MEIDCKHGPILLDDEDAAWVLEDYYVHIMVPRTTFYGPYYQTLTTTKARPAKGRILGRLLLDPPKGLYVDHINHDGRDNRRENLRIVTASQNNSNSRTESITGYRGVVEDLKRRGPNKWAGRLGLGRQQYRARYRPLPSLAALDYNRMIIAMYGREMLINEVPCYSEHPLPRDENCLFCNAPCDCCCVCRDEPSTQMRQLLELAESAYRL